MRRTALLLVALLCAPAWAATYDLPAPGDGLIGAEDWVRAEDEDTLVDFARRYSLGYEELKLANPDVDPWLPGDGTLVLLPSRFVLPAGPREGIVVNLAEMRLYYFPQGSGKVMTFPVSVGREGLGTPLMTTVITHKLRDPVWYPPPSARREHGLPKSVPPGPENPLGALALKLKRPHYLIHGTSRPYGIGIDVTRGCLRLYPEDIERLFDAVEPGTKVRVVNQPWKTGWEHGLLWFEAHTDAPAKLAQAKKPLRAAVRKGFDYDIDWGGVEAALAHQRGLPQPVLRVSPDT